MNQVSSDYRVSDLSNSQLIRLRRMRKTMHVSAEVAKVRANDIESHTRQALIEVEQEIKRRHKRYTVS